LSVPDVETTLPETPTYKMMSFRVYSELAILFIYQAISGMAHYFLTRSLWTSYLNNWRPTLNYFNDYGEGVFELWIASVGICLWLFSSIIIIHYWHIARYNHVYKHQNQKEKTPEVRG